MKNKIIVQDFFCAYGELLLGSYNDKLVLTDWKYRKMRPSIDQRIKNALQSDFHQGDTEVLNQAKQQLKEYFAHQRQTFDLPIEFIGSPFQKRVWKHLLDIPYGSTTSYLELSRSIGDEKAIRAVASANGANAISIIVPCHRVIGKNGKLVGYAGGLTAKKKLLHLELNLKQGSLFG